jgi:holo-[acyl-carrier protein] synthase
MIVGIGVDIAEVERIKKAATRFGDRFLKRVFTEQELAYSMSKMHSYQKLASRFAAKEAAFKALGTGVTKWKEAETTIEPSGKPNLKLHGQAAVRARSLGAVRSYISASDTEHHAVVVVVLESE